MHSAEKLAIERGRTLLVLDTAVDEGAALPDFTRISVSV